MTDHDNATPEQPGIEGDRTLLTLAQVVAITTPGFIRMRGDPNLHGWSADLVAFGEREDLRPLAPALAHVVAGVAAADLFPPLLKAFSEDSAAVPLDTLIRAAGVAEEATRRSPHASFMLAWTTLCLWILGTPRRGEHLYGEREPSPGWPHPGWTSIPAACAAAGTRLNGLYGAQLLAEEAYAVLQATWRRRVTQRPALEPAIAKYRRLEQTIAGRYDTAIVSLIDDLRDACGAGGRMRHVIAALLWSLGLVPESHALRASAGVPSRGVLRRLIHYSMHCVPGDPLIQYLWLEIKEEPGIDLRAHEALFAVINHLWDQWWLDGQYAAFGLSAPPSRIYARTLVSLMADDLDKPAAADYLGTYDFIVDGRMPLPSKGFVLHRLHMLRHLIGERFDYYGPDVSEEQRVGYLTERTDAIGRQLEVAERHPEMPDMLGRSSQASFELIERCLAENPRLRWPERERCVFALEALERFRTGALGYWLRVSPPALSAASPGGFESVLQQERRLVEDLRGAYFLALRPTLPLHNSWADMDIGEWMALQDPRRRQWFYSPDVARDEMDGIERGLMNVAERLEPHAPEYASRRRSPNATFNRIVALLNRHTAAHVTST